MKKFFTLFKVQLKSSFNLSQYISSVKSNKKQLWKLLAVVFFIAAIAPSYILYNGLIQLLFDNLSMVNQQGVVLAAGVAGTSLAVLFFGIMYVFSAFFGAKDLDMLLALPVKPRYIVASKLGSIIAAEYLFTIPLAAPVFINYGVNIGAGILYWIYTVLTILMIPIIPLSIGTFIALLLVRIFGMRINIEKIQMIFMLVFLAAILGINFYATKTGASIQPGSEKEFIMQLISNNRYMIDAISKYYPPAKFAAEGALNYLSFSGLLNIILYGLISAAMFYLAVFTGDKFYIEGVTRGLGGAPSKNKKITEEEMQKSLGAVSSKFMSIFKNDFKILLRTPIFAFNNLLIVPLLPVIIFVSLSSSNKGGLDALRLVYAQYGNEISVFFCVAMIMITGITTVTGSTYSREGSAFWINQIAPIRPIDQLLGRCMGAVLVNASLIILMAVALGIVAERNILLLFIIVIVSIIASLPLTIAGLIIDVLHPYLNWTDPAKAVKQNINVIFCMLAAMILAALFALMAYLMIKANISTYAILAAIALINALLTYGLSKFFIKIMPGAMMFK